MKRFLYILFFVSLGVQAQRTNELSVIVAQDYCETISTNAGTDGFKQWCWNGALRTEINALTDQGFFSGFHLFTSVHYYNDPIGYEPVKAEKGRLHFKADVTSPVPSGSTHDGNYRAEVRDHPSDVDHPPGTEQWWGFNYRMGDDYVPDELPWIMWQTHQDGEAPIVPAPMTDLRFLPTNSSGNTNPVGTLAFQNSAQSTTGGVVTTTTPLLVDGIPFVPLAGESFDVVIYHKWGDDATGEVKIWINGTVVYDQQERTSFIENNYEGGYWKTGIYKWRWQDQINIDASAALGITALNTSIGPMRIVTRKTTNPNYGQDEYNTVKP